MPLRVTSLAVLLLAYSIFGCSADPPSQNSNSESKLSTAPDPARAKTEETMEVGNSPVESRPVIVRIPSRRPRISSKMGHPYSDVPTKWVEDKNNPITGLWDFRGKGHTITIGHSYEPGKQQ